VKHVSGNWRCEFEIEDPDYVEEVVIRDKVKLIARGWRYP